MINETDLIKCQKLKEESLAKIESMINQLSNNCFDIEDKLPYKHGLVEKHTILSSLRLALFKIRIDINNTRDYIKLERENEEG